MKNKENDTIPSSPVAIEHIVIPYSKEVATLFLRTGKDRGQIITYNGKYIATQDVTKKLELELLKLGYVLKYVNKLKHDTRCNVFGIHVSISKNYDGKEIKEFIVTLSAASYEELIINKPKLFTELDSQNSSYRTATSEKFVRC